MGKGKREFLQFLNIAQGSVSELDTHVELAKELGFLDQQSYGDNLNELEVISKQLYGLDKKIRLK